MLEDEMRNSSLLCWLQLFSCSVWVWEKLVVLFVFEEGNISCALSWFVVASLLPSHIPSSLSSTTNVLTVCGRVRLVTEFIYLILNQPSNSLIGAVPPLGNEGKWTIKLVFVGNDVCLCVDLYVCVWLGAALKMSADLHWGSLMSSLFLL